MKKLTIVARYNEDISWSKDLESDIFVYNKGADWPWEKAPRIDIENYGRESETYVRSIIECYHLLDQYDYFVFMQGNPYDHVSDPVKSINNYTSDEIFSLANSMVKYKLPDEKKYFNFETFTICKLFRKEFAPHARIELLNGEIDEKDNRGIEITTAVFFAQMLGIDLSERDITYAAGAQYIVPTSYIKTKSLDWWTEFYSLIQDWKFLNPGDDVGAYCERMWLAIWKLTPILGQKN